MEDYIKSEQIGGGSPRHLNTFSSLYICWLYTTHLSIHAMYGCYCRLHPCPPCGPLHNIRTYHLVAIVDSNYIESATASFEDLLTLHRRTPQHIF